MYLNTSSSNVQLPFSPFPFSLFFSHFGYSSGIFIHMVFLLSLFSFIYLSLQVSLIFLSAIYLFIFLCYYLFSITQLFSLFYKYNFLIFLDISISTFPKHLLIYCYCHCHCYSYSYCEHFTTHLPLLSILSRFL